MFKMRKQPISRRCLGIYDLQRKDGTKYNVAVYVNADMLAFRLGNKAARNKSKRATSIYGAILVEAEPVIVKDPSP
jgi:hypothetical protein